MDGCHGNVIVSPVPVVVVVVVSDLSNAHLGFNSAASFVIILSFCLTLPDVRWPREIIRP